VPLFFFWGGLFFLAFFAPGTGTKGIIYIGVDFWDTTLEVYKILPSESGKLLSSPLKFQIDTQNIAKK